MPGARLEIVFDGDAGTPPRFDPGSELAGRAVFTPDADVKVDAVLFGTRWSTRGKGNRDTGEAWSHREAIDEPGRLVEAGRTVSWPFRCRLPDSPWTYDGKIVAIEWQVFVCLDVPWAQDLKASRPFILRPAGS